MHDVLDAIEAFFAHLSSVELVPLLIAVGCHLVELYMPWTQRIIAAAYPGERVAWPPILGAYVVSVGVNAVVPARAGDVMRLPRAPCGTGKYLHHACLHLCRHGDNGHGARGRAVRPQRSTLGVLPGLSLLPDLRSFDFAWFHTRPRAARDPVPACSRRTGTGDLVAAAAGRLPCSVLRAFSILREPSRYLRGVVAWQLADWALRLVTIWFFLDAFGVEQACRTSSSSR